MLNRWTRFLTAPQTLNFPRLELIAGDWEGPVVVGSGEVRSNDLHGFKFSLEGVPGDLAHAMRSIRRIDQEPYNGLARLRLVGTDSDGVEWMLGWTIPSYSIGNSSWTFRGELETIIPLAEDRDDEEGTELRYVLPEGSQLHWVLVRTVIASGSERPLRRQRRIEAAGAIIDLAYDPGARVLTLKASPSQDLPLTYAENWLSEPFRILFGQPISPRLVSRQIPGQAAIIFIAPIARRIPEAGWAALWNDDTMAREAFWSLYAQILTYLAESRREARDLDPHQLTRFYEEVMIASRGSRWVWAMTFASVIEGLVKMIDPDSLPANQAALDAFIAHVQTSPEGTGELQGPAIAAVANLGRTSVIDKIRGLERAGLVTPRQRKAWVKLRNKVMHGSLVSPYSSQTEDDRLLALAEMMHALTQELLRRGTAQAETGDTTEPQ